MANYNLRLGSHIRDSKGTLAVASAFGSTADTVTIAQLMSDVNTWAADVDACTWGQTQEVTVALLGAPPSTVGRPTSDAKAYEVGTVSWTNTVNNRLWGFVIPSFNQTLVSGKTVPWTSGVVQTLNTFMFGGATHIAFSNDDYLTLAGVVRAFPAIRQRRRSIH